MPASRRPFDIVHLAQTTFPEDPRPRREAMIAAETGARVVIVVIGGGRDARRVSRYGRIAVVRLEGERRRGSAVGYVGEYLDFLLRARALIRHDPRFQSARIFHVHTLPDFLVGATRSARKRGAQVILDLHEIFPEFTESKFPGWKGRIGRRVALWLERWSRRQADVVVTVNRAVESQLRARPARPHERIAVVHNFADPAEFGPEQLTTGVIQEPVRLVYHGTLTPLYGLDLAITAVARARESGLDVSLDLFGSGPSASSLTDLITRLGVHDRVQLRGIVPHHILRDLLPAYDAGLVPTRLDVMTRFSLSTKLLEYIHLGLPVIIPAIPTYLDYFPPACAWYFEPNSATDMARAIAKFVGAEPGERVQRAAAAQAASAAQLDPEVDAAVLKGLYEEMLGRGEPA